MTIDHNKMSSILNSEVGENVSSPHGQLQGVPDFRAVEKTDADRLADIRRTLAELDALHAASTPGEWFCSNYLDTEEWGIVSIRNEITQHLSGKTPRANGVFIAAAHNHYSTLRKIIDGLVAENGRLREELAASIVGREISDSAFRRMVKVIESGPKRGVIASDGRTPDEEGLP